MGETRPRTRADWVSLSERMLQAVRPFASESHALIPLPGREGGYGHHVDGLEGFARTFLLAGFRAAGDPTDLAHLSRYADGLAAGTDPNHSDRWPRLDEHPQAKVEAALIAWVLDLTREHLWDQLDRSVQSQVINYLSPAVGDHTYPPINWVWFRLAVQTFLRSVDGPFRIEEMKADLATHDSFLRADGWIADGSKRSFDHYVGWMLTFFPTIWGRMAGASDLAAPRADADRAVLDRYLVDAVRLVGGDGSPLIQGRSLIYRFAAAAPFWAGVLSDVPSVPGGVLKHAASAVVGHFVERGALNDQSLLTMGWHHEWRTMAQAYSGPSSPYWGSLGMLGLALPADHPVWGLDEEPLPVQTADAVFTVRGPGWVVSSTREDGVVRVINHGTDHALPGELIGDSPLYARLGYSTASAPLMDAGGWAQPTDNCVALVDEDGRRSHRAGMHLTHLSVQETDAGPVGVAASRTDAHWLSPDDNQQNHGYGHEGAVEHAGTLQVVSFVRGPWEIRASRVDSPSADARAVVVAGWPLVPAVEHRLRSLVVPLATADVAVSSHHDASPLGPEARVPEATFEFRPGVWQAALLALGVRDEAESSAELTSSGEHVEARLVWPDGQRTDLVVHLSKDLHPSRTPSKGEK